MAEFGTRLEALIKALGITKTAFSEKINVSQAYVSQMCANQKFPSDRTIADICRVYNANEQWLRTGEGEMFLDLPPDKELDEIFAQIRVSDDTTIKAIIRVYWRLSDGDKTVIRKVIADIADEQKKDRG